MTNQCACGLELKYCDAGFDRKLVDKGIISGYATLFGVPDRSGDVVRKGAFSNSLASYAATGNKIKMLWQHDVNRPIGVWESIQEDDKGLFVQGRIIEEVAIGKEAAILLRAGALDGLSIGFRCEESEDGSMGRRVITRLELWEISLVTFPMLPQARAVMEHEEIQSKSLDAILRELRDIRAQIETHY